MKLVTFPCALALFVLTHAPQPRAQETAGDPNPPVPQGAQQVTRNEGEPTAHGAAFSLSGSLDRGLVLPTSDGWLLSGSSYRADVATDGLRFVPTDLSASGRSVQGLGELELSLRALAAEDGERELSPSGRPVRPGGLFGAAVVTPYAADGLLQTVQAHPDGVELGVWVVQRPQQQGDLRLVFGLQASLERLLVETTAGNHVELALGGQGAARIGRATAIDAAGRRSELSMQLTTGRLEIVLDAALLATATFPLWVDPKIGSALPVSASPSTRDVDPDVVFDPLAGEFLVVWERAIAAGESDIWGARVDTTGALTSGPFPVDATAATVATRPRIALDPATGHYLVVYEDDVSGGPGVTVRWSLFDAADDLITSQSFTVSGYLSDTRPDVGFVGGPAGSSGFVLVHRRATLSAPDSTVEVSWIDAATGAVIDAQTVAPLATPRDSLPAVAQLAQGGASLVAFQRFDTGGSDLDVLASCIGLGGGVVTLGAPVAVSADLAAADGAPDVSAVDGTFQVVWERLVLATSNRNLRGREVLPACAGFGGAAVDVTNLPLIEAQPALAAGRYAGACDGQSLVLFTTTNSPAGSAPVSAATRRWNSPGASFGTFETVAQGQAGVASFSTPRAALDTASTAFPRFLVVYDDDGSGTNASAEVLGQLFTFDAIPLTAEVGPAAVTSCVGGPVTFTATVTGTGPFTYQWRQDGLPISGATASSYTIPAVATGSAGTYDVEVTGACGAIFSSTATLAVDEPITVVTISASASPVCVGTDVTLTAATATGVPSSYGWFRDGVFLQVTSVPTLVLTNVQPGDAGAYTVTASNTCGNETSAVPATLEVETAITGVSISASASPVCVGTDVTLTAATATGIPSSYGWFRDGAFLQVTSVPTLVLSSVQPGDAGDYTVTASNTCGDVTSPTPATLEVEETITGVTISASASPVCVGTDVTLTAATATGVPSSYGWFRDGVFLQVTSVPTLVLTNVQPGDAGAYTVTASNTCGDVTSPTPATLEVEETITGVTISASASPVCVGTDVTLTAATATGVPSSYGWFRDGVFLQVTSVPTLVLSSVQPGAAGDYTVTASNTCGDVTSPTPATLEVGETITGVTISASASPVCVGTDVVLTAATATGEPSSYGWFRDGVFLQVTSVPTLVLSSVQPGAAGDYTVTASNTCGNATSPVPATLDVDEAITGVAIGVSASPVCVGTDVTLTAATATGVPSSYGWFRDGVFLQATTAPTLVLTNVQPSSAGEYTVTASNTCGDVTSPVPVALDVDEVITGVAIGVSASPVCVGTDVTLTAATATGVPSSYGWFRDGVFLQVTSVPTLVLSSVQPGAAGDYTVTASNSCGNVTSAAAATLEVVEPLTAVTISGSAFECSGQPATFDATPVGGGGGTITYQWYLDGGALSGATASSLTLAAVQPGDAGTYTVEVGNACGTVTSLGWVFAVGASPAGASVGVSSLNACLGTSVDFTATISAGTAPLQYEWFKDGVSLGAPSSSNVLSIPSVQASDAGSYLVRVSNACGSDDSAPVTLDVSEPPSGAAVSASATTFCLLNSVTLTGSASGGTGPFLYEWFKDGLSLGPPTSGATFSIAAAQPGDAGDYQVQVSNACGAQLSAAITLTYLEAPAGLTASVSAPVVCAGASVDFTATLAVGAQPVLYEWFKDGVSLGAPSASTVYSIPAAQAGDAGSYFVRASNTCGTLDSAAVLLDVDQPPSGVTATASASTVCLQGSVTITASVSAGSGPFLYEWFKDGVSLGAPGSNNVLTILFVQASDDGDYRVAASNGCGSETSSAVTLTVFSAPTTYCTAKPNSLGCSSILSWSGSPSASGGGAFDITYGPVPGKSFGVYIYTTLGQAATPVQNAFGTLCLDQTSIWRAPPMFSGGTGGSCDGTYALDFNAFFASPSAPPILQPGSAVDMQCWYRDPANPGGANFSNAIHFVMCP